jgi:hypothetical protein
VRLVEEGPTQLPIWSKTQVKALAEFTNTTPALAEIEEALVPALIVEKLEDGSYTVLVPSVPTPMAGAIYTCRPNGCIRLRCSRNGAPAPVTSSGRCKWQSHPRPWRRRADQPRGPPRDGQMLLVAGDPIGAIELRMQKELA